MSAQAQAAEAVLSYVRSFEHAPRSDVGRMLSEARELGSRSPVEDVTALVTGVLEHSSLTFEEATADPWRAVQIAREVDAFRVEVAGYDCEEGADEYESA